MNTIWALKPTVLQDMEVQKKPMGMPFDWHLPGSRDLKAAAAVGVPGSLTAWSPEPFREQ